MLEEGRTTTRVKALLEDIFRPDDLFSLASVHLTVTDDMAKDIKEINLGYNNDLSYDSSHRGVSPFAVIGVSMATASRRRRHADRFTRTTNLTLAEVAMSDTTPDPIPTEYHMAPSTYCPDMSNSSGASLVTDANITWKYVGSRPS